MRFIILIVIVIFNSIKANKQNDIDDLKEIIVNEFRKDDTVSKDIELNEDNDRQKKSKVINHPNEINDTKNINSGQSINLKKEQKNSLKSDIMKDQINSFSFEKTENNNQKTNVSQDFQVDSNLKEEHFRNENKQQSEGFNDISYNVNYNENKEKINKSLLSSVTYYSKSSDSVDKQIVNNKVDETFETKDNIKYYEKPLINKYNQNSDYANNIDYFQTKVGKAYNLIENNHNLNNPSIMTNIYSNHQTPIYNENKEALIYDQNSYSQNMPILPSNNNNIISYPINQSQNYFNYDNQKIPQEMINHNYLLLENNHPMAQETNYNAVLQNTNTNLNFNQQNQERFYPVSEIPHQNNQYEQVELPNITNYNEIINLLKTNIDSKMISKVISFIEKRKLELKERNTYLINKLNDNQNLIYEQTLSNH